MRRLLLLSFSILLLSAPSAPAAEPTILQRQWMHNLVDAMGWTYGLPDEPADADYLRILEGDRHFHFEAEDIVGSEDVVAIRTQENFGPFSGGGWVGGISGPTTANLEFLLPLAGSYRLSASLLGTGHRFAAGGRTATVDGGRTFTVTEVAEVSLAAGVRIVKDTLPPGGGIDYLELSAPPLAPIRPRGGWAPSRPLTRDDLAVTTARLFGLEPLLPDTGENQLIEAETAGEPGGATVSTARFLGEPSGGRWLRAGPARTALTLDFPVSSPGAYRLHLRLVGTAPVTGRLDGREPLDLTPPPALAEVPAGVHYLEAGRHRLELSLPPRAGVDRIRLERLASTSADYLRLAGMSAEEGLPTAAELDRLLKLLAAIGNPR